MGASAHEIVMESRQEIVDKLIAQMEKVMRVQGLPGIV